MANVDIGCPSHFFDRLPSTSCRSQPWVLLYIRRVHLAGSHFHGPGDPQSLERIEEDAPGLEKELLQAANNFPCMIPFRNLQESSQSASNLGDYDSGEERVDGSPNPAHYNISS